MPKRLRTESALAVLLVIEAVVFGITGQNFFTGGNAFEIVRLEPKPRRRVSSASANCSPERGPMTGWWCEGHEDESLPLLRQGGGLDRQGTTGIP